MLFNCDFTFTFYGPLLKKVTLRFFIDYVLIDLASSIASILNMTVDISVRLYDVRTFQCFVASNPNDQHKKAITGVSTIFFFTKIVTFPSICEFLKYFEIVYPTFANVLKFCT